MEYLLPSFLILVSYFLGAFFSIQGSRDPVFRPIGLSDGISLILIIIFGIVPFAIGLYLIYKIGGVFFSIGYILIRFLILPGLLNKLMEKVILEKNEKINL